VPTLSRIHQSIGAVAAQVGVLKGGGGTNMRVCIAAAEALKPRPDAVVVLTDGATPWLEAPGSSRLICGVISAQPPSGTPSWATTVHIPVGG
jgi:hypothetical protein